MKKTLVLKNKKTGKKIALSKTVKEPIKVKRPRGGARA